MDHDIEQLQQKILAPEGEVSKLSVFKEKVPQSEMHLVKEGQYNMIVEKSRGTSVELEKVNSQVFTDLPRTNLEQTRKYKKGYYLDFSEKLMMLDQVQ